MTDPSFIERLRKGEETAFYQLVEDWKDRIYNTALGLVQQAQDAEDITQEVFIIAWKSIHRFRGESSIQTWLFKIAVHQSLDLIRKKQRKKRFGWITPIFGTAENGATDPGDFVHPGVQLEKKQEAQLLFKAIKKLPEQQQVAYSLQKMEGLTLKEIAAVLETTEGAVEALLHRAKSNLQKTLTNYYQTHKHE
ncbi:RNA polymerase sigma factor [Flavihumibacter sp. CACIAM 22H1]|uniref:RNA polymerase sigma factor n=1 Tax=Flavihumibacter sp. CACIAM 22H1 TaxID=1812911 RepID=UPI0007A8A37F|nr:RNA polymerase sigma factor [Flavihumibacter sp. CACIAM 22H1]KYP15807.1 MAG: hypothetical protein A1D16_10290 [Flavihumibacter sp. CACIAM 22H1]